MTNFNQIPVIKLWRLLVVPLQGEIDDNAAALLSEQVLERIHSEEISGLVIDVTGLWLMDSHLCALLTRLARSAELMGTRTVLCGMTAQTAMTLQDMGLELEGFDAMLSLEQALEHHGVYSPWSGLDNATEDAGLDDDLESLSRM
jgi:rsbT antagonist protein RsbS